MNQFGQQPPQGWPQQQQTQQQFAPQPAVGAPPQQGFGAPPQYQPQQVQPGWPAQQQPPQQGFGAPPQGMPGYGGQVAPSQQQNFGAPQQYQQPPQGYGQQQYQQAASQMVGNAPTVDLNATLAGAQAGADRFPLLETNGEFLLQFDESEIGRSGTLKLHFTVIQCTDPRYAPGTKVTELLQLTGQSQKSTEAKRGAAKRTLFRLAGYQEEAAANPVMPQIYTAIQEGGGALKGRQVRVQVNDSGKKTRPEKGSQTIWNKNWIPV